MLSLQFKLYRFKKAKEDADKFNNKFYLSITIHPFDTKFGNPSSNNL